MEDYGLEATWRGIEDFLKISPINVFFHSGKLGRRLQAFGNETDSGELFILSNASPHPNAYRHTNAYRHPAYRSKREVAEADSNATAYGVVGGALADEVARDAQRNLVVHGNRQPGELDDVPAHTLTITLILTHTFNLTSHLSPPTSHLSPSPSPSALTLSPHPHPQPSPSPSALTLNPLTDPHLRPACHPHPRPQPHPRTHPHVSPITLHTIQVKTSLCILATSNRIATRRTPYHRQ